MSLYQYAGNNPILFVDINGDSIGVGNLSAEQAKAMERFAKNKRGRNFLAQYAKKGQTVFGITFNKQEKYDKQGINLNYATGVSETKSTTNSKENKSGGIDINVSLATKGFGFDNTTLSLVKSITHESFIHADMDTKDWRDDKKLNNSNLSEWTKKHLPDGVLYSYLKEHGQHYEISRSFYTNQSDAASLWPAQGLQVLKSVSIALGVKISENQIKSSIWNFGGSLIVVDPKSGKVSWKR